MQIQAHKYLQLANKLHTYIKCRKLHHHCCTQNLVSSLSTQQISVPFPGHDLVVVGRINSNFGTQSLCFTTVSANHNNNHHQLLFHLIYLIFCCKKVFAHSGFVTVGIYPRFHPPTTMVMEGFLHRAEHLHKSSAIILRMQRHLGDSVYFSVGKWGFNATRLFPHPGPQCQPTELRLWSVSVGGWKPGGNPSTIYITTWYQSRPSTVCTVLPRPSLSERSLHQLLLFCFAHLSNIKKSGVCFEITPFLCSINPREIRRWPK